MSFWVRGPSETKALRRHLVYPGFARELKENEYPLTACQGRH
jgi:hypothetical protein